MVTRVQKIQYSKLPCYSCWHVRRQEARVRGHLDHNRARVSDGRRDRGDKVFRDLRHRPRIHQVLLHRSRTRRPLLRKAQKRRTSTEQRPRLSHSQIPIKKNSPPRHPRSNTITKEFPKRSLLSTTSLGISKPLIFTTTTTTD